jgi:hypothetical protein
MFYMDLVFVNAPFYAHSPFRFKGSSTDAFLIGKHRMTFKP